ncbi:hypothetical protein EVAR_99346_1, partial [Eumeta japonica]
IRQVHVATLPPSSTSSPSAPSLTMRPLHPPDILFLSLRLAAGGDSSVSRLSMAGDDHHALLAPMLFALRLCYKTF